ncbi:MAG: hypothetical protein ACXQTB_02220 [Candidatus Nezhaarchaeales archaeon]
MRGVVIFNPADDVSQDLKWLSERFKYRILGVPPSLTDKISRMMKPLISLAYPHKELIDFIKFVSETLNIDHEIAEAICLASCYVSPILALGSKSQESLKSISISEVPTKIKMSLQDWKLHLRIADYSVLDLYEWSTSHAQKLWDSEVDIENLVAERLKAIRKDEKRYWRLQRGDLEPTTFLVYLDLVQTLWKKLVGLKVLSKYDKDVASACLAINVAVFIKPP